MAIIIQELFAGINNNPAIIIKPAIAKYANAREQDFILSAANPANGAAKIPIAYALIILIEQLKLKKHQIHLSDME